MRIAAKIGITLCALLLGTGARSETARECDRDCLTLLADDMLGSMLRHQPEGVPLAPVYRATENGVPAALPMMTIWRNATSADHRFYVVDPQSGQLFLLADIAEGSGHALLFGRIKVVGRRLTEIELYIDRSRSDGGFMFDATALAALPDTWTRQVPASRLPSRSALLRAGRTIFDTRADGPPADPSCRMMENGRMVAEDPDVLKMVGPGGNIPRANADGTVPIPCGQPSIRPTDPEARTDIVDEKLGIVVSIGTVYGTVYPYLITAPTTSAFVPTAMARPYLDLLERQRARGAQSVKPELAPTAASITVAEMHRYYDGKLQGMHLLEKVGPAGAKSPWTTTNN